MIALKLKAVIGQDRRLVLELPQDTPIGSVEVTIESQPQKHPISLDLPPTLNSAREAVRAKLLSAGYLVTEFNFDIPDDYVPLTHEQRMKMTTPTASAKTIFDLVNEDRGEW
jgi:hypothetical protein